MSSRVRRGAPEPARKEVTARGVGFGQGSVPLRYQLVGSGHVIQCPPPRTTWTLLFFFHYALRGESIGGLVCNLFGFALAIVLVSILALLAAGHHHLRGNGTARHGRLQIARDLVRRVAILCAVHPPGVCAAQGTTIPARHNTQTGKQRPTKRRRAHAARAR